MSQGGSFGGGGSGGGGIETINSVGPDGGGNFTITSSDGSVVITPTANGTDLSVPDAATPVILSVGMTTPTSLSQNALSPIIYDTIITDTASGYNVTTGTYTFPISGSYLIAFATNFTSTAGFTTCDVFFMDGGNFTFHGESTATVSDPTVVIMCASFISNFNSGDVVGMDVFAQTTGATSFIANGFANGFSNTLGITKIG
jgi:hypothetical protein